MPTILLPGAVPPESHTAPAAPASPSAAARASKDEAPEVSGLEAIEARLDHLSEQMDLCLAELVAGSKNTPPSGQAASSLSAKFLKVFPSTESAGKGSKRPTARSSKASQRWSQRTEITVVDPTANKRASIGTTRRTQAAPRSVDLEIAWRLHAKDMNQDGSAGTPKPLLRLVQRSRADVMWELLDDPNSSQAAWFVSQLLKVMVIVSVLWSNLQTTEVSVLDTTSAAILEITFDAVFLVEFLCRVFSAPSKRNYFMDPLNWADIGSALGLPVRACIGFVLVPGASGAAKWAQYVLLFVLPLVRFLKLLRYFESFRLLIDACRASAEALPVLIYMTCLIVLLSATMIYLVEERTTIPSMPHAMWLALVTMTTVGYGDYYPTSVAGYFTVAVLTFVSVLFLALPVGIIGYEFTMSWQSRVQVLLMTRFRKALNKWGYNAEDLGVLINYVDVNSDGELTFDEFVELIKQMRIGISTEEAALLFGFFDLDQSGAVDYSEMMKQLFPMEYVKAAGDAAKHRASSGGGSATSRERVSAALEMYEERQTSPKGDDESFPESHPET